MPLPVVEAAKTLPLDPATLRTVRDPGKSKRTRVVGVPDCASARVRKPGKRQTATQMANLTRKEFAVRRGVDPGTVTKWDRRGILVLTDNGKVNVEATERILDQRPAKYRGGTTHRPARISPKEAPKAAPEPVEAHADEEDFAFAARCVRATLGRVLDRCKPIVAAMVVEAGVSIPVAYGLTEILRMELHGLASEAMEHFGHAEFAPYSDSPLDPRPWPGMQPDAPQEPDWPKLAALAGEPFDQAACEAHTTRLPYFADDTYSTEWVPSVCAPQGRPTKG
ncbi:hypothetical protein [Methylobacterium sp. ID0610]|uniref:hypothetical protein n=1 Tax=Methylobacterium carpenticola TaxID=3344827 RepID=UPI0036BA280B